MSFVSCRYHQPLLELIDQTPNLNDKTFRTLVRLSLKWLDLGNGAWSMTLQALADDLGCSEATVSRSLRVIQRTGLLDIDAETEIRVFENELRADGPVRRYKVRLVLERAISVAGLMAEDKAKLLNDAHDSAVALLERNPNLPHNLRLFADVCLEIFKATGDYDYVDSVRSAMKRAESDTSDPEVTQALVSFEHRLTRTGGTSGDLGTTDLDDADGLVDTE